MSSCRAAAASHHSHKDLFKVSSPAEQSNQQRVESGSASRRPNPIKNQPPPLSLELSKRPKTHNLYLPAQSPTSSHSAQQPGASSSGRAAKRLREIAQTEHLAEQLEEAIFAEALRLAVKPACFVALALPSLKAGKPTPDQCQETLSRREVQRRHERQVTLPTHLSRLAASNSLQNFRQSACHQSNAGFGQTMGATSSLSNLQAMVNGTTTAANEIEEESRKMHHHEQYFESETVRDESCDSDGAFSSGGHNYFKPKRVKSGANTAALALHCSHDDDIDSQQKQLSSQTASFAYHNDHIDDTQSNSRSNR